MKIEVSVSDDIDAISQLFKDSPAKTRKAINRALRNVSRFVERSVYREIASDISVTQKVLKELGRITVRLYEPSRNSNADFALIIWIGTYNIAAHKLGKPVQTAKGVKTGKHFWDGATLGVA